MKILVIGGTGFLGYHLVKYLEKQGHKVSILDKKKGHFKNENNKIILGDINNFRKLSKVIKNQDIVYNFAAISDIGESIKNPIGTAKNNILGNLLVLDLCVKNKIKKFIYSSSLYVNGDHGGFYSCSKKACENYIEEYERKYNLNFLILRFGSLYGSGSDMSNGLHRIIFNSLKKKQVYYEGNPETSREYIHVEDAGRATIDLALLKNFKNQKINISGHNTIKITELLEMIKEITQIKDKIKFINKKQTGHYIRVPYTSEKIPKKYIINPSIDFPEGLNNLIKQIKKEI